ncbi:MAG TPA: hypothetical protein VGP62_12265 [Bryobacteraceae bacterium]|nr:hypothetical protein [Bryobacteraceae bacterium]
MEAAVNPEANIPQFILQFQPPFPVGKADQIAAMEFMQFSLVVRPPFVPYIAFIDRQGMIRRQLTGTELTDETQEKVLREIAENLVTEGSTAAKPKAKR